MFSESRVFYIIHEKADVRFAIITSFLYVEWSSLRTYQISVFKISYVDYLNFESIS